MVSTESLSLHRLYVFSNIILRISHFISPESQEEEARRGCFAQCGHKSGPCDECGTNGLCCKKRVVENGCDGRMGKLSHYACVTPEDPPTPDGPTVDLTGNYSAFASKCSKFPH